MGDKELLAIISDVVKEKFFKSTYYEKPHLKKAKIAISLEIEDGMEKG